MGKRRQPEREGVGEINKSVKEKGKKNKKTEKTKNEVEGLRRQTDTHTPTKRQTDRE